MSIGARLKEERNRLGMSQADFAGLAGATKGAQLKWEKDEASPNALALVAFGEAGADILYILRGERQSGNQTTGNHSDLMPLASQLRSGFDFSVLEAEIVRLKAKESRDSFAARLLEIYKDYLTGIATKDCYPVSAKSAADNILISQFNDLDAKERSSNRYSRMVEHETAIRREVNGFISEHDIRLPKILYHAIVTIISLYRVDSAHIAPLLEGLRLMQGDLDG